MCTNNELKSNSYKISYLMYQNCILLLDIPFNATTCSKDAFMRGSGQKVVGFSFYGDINTPKNKKKGKCVMF